MKKIALVAVLIVTSIVLVLFFSLLSNPISGSDPFYVGVTYCGESVKEAKQLIDKVKDYTNLFVLQSGILKNDASAVNEIGDYAISKGLHFAAYFDVIGSAQNAVWIGTIKQRWGDMFAGVYLGDEPGGKMLDGTATFTLQGITVNKSNNGTISYDDSNECWTAFFPDGKITVQKSNDTFSSEADPNNSSITISNTLSKTNLTTYEPNGSITVRETINITTVKVYTGGSPYGHYDAGTSYQVIKDNFYTMENGSDRIAQEETYQQIKSKNPIPDCNTAANLYINKTEEPIDNLRNQWNISKRDFPIFTSDYVLYSFDYKAGYDVVLAQFGWNHTLAQDIALVRGAANLQNKNWGVIITWKYNHPPYLDSGETIFEQMRSSYEAGAKYVVIFNYAENMSGLYGTLKNEHFVALERFWKDVVQNPEVKQGSINAEAVLVLPENYGWGMRYVDDKIWGLWEADEKAEQIWNLRTKLLNEYGLNLDIVYEDSEFPIEGKYSNIFFWNQAT